MAAGGALHSYAKYRRFGNRRLRTRTRHRYGRKRVIQFLKEKGAVLKKGLLSLVRGKISLALVREVLINILLPRESKRSSLASL